MKKSILFFTAPVKSHIIPSFYIANLLAKEYEITYAVSNSYLKELVQANHFKTIKVSRYRAFNAMDLQFALDKFKIKPTFLNHVKTIWNQDLIKFRKNELKYICQKVRPHAIFLDVFISPEYVLLKGIKYSENLFFFNIMPSLYRVPNYPSISDADFISQKKSVTKLAFPSPKIITKNWFFNFRKSFFDKIVFQTYMRILKDNGILLEDLAENNELTVGFKNIPEFVLTPIEFEFSPTIKQSWKHYLGLCISQNRQELEIDIEFTSKWPDIVEAFKEKQFIYCSFGTYYSGSNQAILEFLENLLEAMKSLDNCILVVSVNKVVIQSLSKHLVLKDNVHFFTNVPQLEVLKKATVFIIHGGMGSIKESIAFGVPMLVYPLDAQNDQYGNALKVEYHKIGLRGNLLLEKKEQIMIKLMKLMNDKYYSLNIRKFKERIDLSTSGQNLIFLNQLINSSKVKA